jgi:hypothetical protein
MKYCSGTVAEEWGAVPPGPNVCHCCSVAKYEVLFWYSGGGVGGSCPLVLMSANELKAVLPHATDANFYELE